MKLGFITSLLFSTNLYAAGDIPVDTIIVQLVNVSIFIGILIYFLRPVVKSHFSGRKNIYIETVGKAEELKKEADQQKAEIESKIASFKKTAEREMSEAKTEAEALKNSIIKQGEELSVNIEKEAKKAIANELEKAKQNLRAEILSQSLADARENFSSKLTANDHDTMNKRFVDSVGAN